MEETDVDLKVPHDLASQMEAVLETQKTGKAPRKKINTKNILFVVSGAFNNLDQIVKRRLKTNKIGFSDENRKVFKGEEYMDFVCAEDLIEYGFESEFVGRLPVIGKLRELGVDGLFQILQNPRSAVISSKKRDFKSYNIDLDFDEDALQIIAERADKEKTGARGLVSVMEKLLLSFENKLPSTNIKKLKVTKEVVHNSGSVLQEMIYDETLANFQREFLVKHSVVVEFTAGARSRLKTLAGKGKDLKKYLETNFADYGYGLKLTNAENFKITSEVLKNPKEYLDTLIKKTYRENKK